MSDVWTLFNSVEAESVVNALRRWQSAFSANQNRKQAPTIIDPYVRCVYSMLMHIRNPLQSSALAHLPLCSMQACVRQRLCREPLDR